MDANLLDLAELAIKKADSLGANETEAYTVRVSEKSLSLRRGSIEVSKAGSIIGLAIRVSCNEKVSLAGGVVSSSSDVEKLAEKVMAMCRAQSELEAWRGLPRGLSSSRPEGTYDKVIAEITLNGLAELANQLVSEVAEISDKKVEVARGSLHTSSIARLVINSQMEKVFEEATYLFVSAEGVSRDVGLESAFWNTSSARRLQDLDLKAFVDHLVERTLAGLKRAKCESGSQQVLLAPRVSASVLDALLAPAVSALSIQKKRSPLFNKVGQEVFSDQVTVIDDPTLEAMFGSRGFDDEGVRTRRKNVIERGVFKTPLYDTWTARVDETESTGNAVRVKISSMPEPGPLNLILEPGDKSFESLVQEVRKGLVVYGVIGEWLSDYTRGYLNATIVNADCVIDGEVKGAIVSGMLSGDFYEMLRLKLIAKSRELNNVGVVYAPALLLDEVKVTL